MRSHFCILIAMFLVALAGCAANSQPAAEKAPGKAWLYVGTYTGKNSKGIYRVQMDLATGTTGPLELAAETTNPSFLAVDPGMRHLYAVGELSGRGGGAVSAFALDRGSGELKPLNQQNSAGNGPCHVGVDPSGRDVLVANYGSGSVGVFPVEADGSLKAASHKMQHTGKGPNPSRQEGPHAHGIFLDPSAQFALVPDLGLDKVMIYKFDAKAGSLGMNDPAFAAVAPGSGPRHLAFSPDNKFVYVICEMGCSITTFSWDARHGAMTEVQTVPTLPRDFTGESTCAEIAVHPNGKFVYGSNRGHDSIAIFSRDARTGELTPAGHQKSGGKMPRYFGIDPTGRWLLAAHQGSDNIVVFSINPETGQLTRIATELKVGAPVCIVFVPL